MFVYIQFLFSNGQTSCGPTALPTCSVTSHDVERVLVSRPLEQGCGSGWMLVLQQWGYCMAPMLVPPQLQREHCSIRRISEGGAPRKQVGFAWISSPASEVLIGAGLVWSS